MARKLASDTMLFTVTAALIGFGLVMVWSASTALAEEKYDSAHHFLVRQLVCAGVGLAALLATLRFDYRRLRGRGVVAALLLLATFLLILVLFLPTVNESRRWIRVMGLSFQPSELAKLAVVLFLASHIARREERVNELFTSVFPAFLVLGWFSFLISIERDIGTALTLAVTGCVMLTLAGVRLRYFAVFGAVALASLYQMIVLAAYRRERLSAFINPWADAQGSGYHIIQSLIAVGTGGVTGVGLTDGRQKLFYLPYAWSDFIYAVIGEELGLVGALLTVGAFLLFLWRGLRTAFRAPDRFGMFLAGGLTLSIVLQAFINISIVLGLLPPKGIPLPFVSAGGSSLVLSMAAVGVVLNVSQHAD
ncbi:MAG: putative lipid II flippase FtsW [Vicinamibacteria bacterium]|nr:putative lipid II flippase FtsW [Vicinamibacteria bacterium]